MTIAESVKPHATLVRDVEIDVDAVGRGTVRVDGWDASEMSCAFTLRSEVGELSRLTLDLLPSVTKAQVAAVVQVDEATHEFLVALGWTPPGAQY